MLKRLGLVACLLMMAGCCRDYLTVRTEYFNRHSLASYYVGTPDPKLNYPEVGQRLIISWTFPNEVYFRPDLRFELTMRFGNKKEVKEMIKVYDRFGIYTYNLYDDVFFEYDGIETYKVDLYSGDELLTEWRHQLWVDLITFKEPTENTEEDKEED